MRQTNGLGACLAGHRHPVRQPENLAGVRSDGLCREHCAGPAPTMPVYAKNIFLRLSGN